MIKTLDGIDIRLDNVKANICELENVASETTKSKMQSGKKKEKGKIIVLHDFFFSVLRIVIHFGSNYFIT